MSTFRVLGLGPVLGVLSTRLFVFVRTLELFFLVTTMVMDVLLSVELTTVVIRRPQNTDISLVKYS